MFDDGADSSDLEIIEVRKKTDPAKDMNGNAEIPSE
jgi:hypothetical protein